MRRNLILILSFLLFAACTMPETKIYSLSLSSEEKKNNVRIDASVNILVHSPRYLAQPYIAHRISPYQIEISRYSKWDSAPVDIVKESFKDSFSTMFKEVRASNSTSDKFYSIDINLKKFEKINGSDNPSGELAFDVILISPDGKELYRNTITKRVKLIDLNNINLAKGLSSALTEGIEEVKAGINNAFSFIRY